ncbi:molybdopterin-dependent oxidoreductase [Haladaptatus sp. NG-SE-30]
MSLTRRDFIHGAGTGAVGALLTSGWAATQGVDPVTDVPNPLKSYPNRDWEEVYRNIYAYDEVDWSVCHPNCTQSCSLNFYMKNGVPIRAEQIYHNEKPSVGPSGYEDANVSQNWNPRGCMKGLTLHRRTFEPSRIKYPMVRKGWSPDDPNPKGRGEDEFKRVSWDEAVDLIAEKMASLDDRKRFHVFNAIKADGLITRHGAGRRLASIFGGCEWTEYDWYADLPPGHVMTTGYQTSDSDANAWRKGDYTIIQGKNLIHNKLADNHWLQEARERGGKMVGIYPDYSPTVQKCDRWLPVRPGSDPAIPLGFAYVIIKEELYDADFMRKFTSLPLLVRDDDGKYLRAHEVFSDHEPPSEGDEHDWGDFVILNQNGTPVPVTREDVGDKMPATPRLEADTKLSLANGGTVQARTDFTRQKQNVMENYSPKTVSDITTIPAKAIRQTAREFAAAENGQWFTGEGINHWFHANSELQRSIFFVQSMLGNIGDAGKGYYNYSGQYKIELLDGYPHYVNPDGMSATGMYPGYALAFFGGKQLDPHRIRGDFDRELDLVPQGDANEPVMPKGAKSYTLSKPTILWTMNCNLLNQTKHQEHVINNFTKHPDTSNELFIVSDIHMTYSARYADIVLPVPSWLECDYPDITVGPENPFITMDHGVMDSIYDTMQDGEIIARVAEKLDEKIPESERDISYRSYFSEFLDKDGDVRKYIQETLDAGMTTQDIDVKDLEKGPQRLNLKTYPRIPFYSQIHDDRPFYTKTGRMEFHKEEDRLIELGRDDLDHIESVEGTPYGVNKKWDKAKKEKNPLYHDEGYQFYYNTPHSKYRTHSSWGMTDWNLIWSARDFGSTSANPEGTERLVDDFSFPEGDGETSEAPPLGEAFVEIHPSDAKAIDIKNGDYVRIKGKRGDTVVRAMLSERQRPGKAGDMGQLTIWHGWWPQHFPDDEDAAGDDNVKGFNVTTNIWLDPGQEIDELVHKGVFGDPNVSDVVPKNIAWHGAELEHGYEETVWAPTGVNRDDLVTVEKYREADWWPGDARRDDLIQDYIGGSLQSKGNSTTTTGGGK